jgi:hypothetical protein
MTIESRNRYLQMAEYCGRMSCTYSEMCEQCRSALYIVFAAEYAKKAWHYANLAV